MKLICDFHIHSKYSRATSRDMDLEHLDLWAKIKGIDVIGSGDFTHPAWLQDLKTKLEPQESGLFKLKKGLNEDLLKSSVLPPKIKETYFILTTEISCIYSKAGRVRKIHLLIFAPDLKTVEKINVQLSWIGNLKSDGRPILGLDAKELAKIVLTSNPNCLVVPCHIWTPWFSVFGSMSGFDSIQECFEEYSKYIFAGETGLSSDPEMNWRLSTLDKINLISNSDAHSPAKIGREANIFDCELSYEDIINSIRKKNPKKFLATIEFFPEEGKYHFDGHRLCGIRWSPSETIKNKGICPKCKKPVTVGVMSRVEKLADRRLPKKPADSPDSLHLIPLEEIIAAVYGVSVGTKKTQEDYQNLVKNLGTEFEILQDSPISEIEKFSSKEVADGVSRVRQGKVKLLPGFDGKYGKILIFEKVPEEKKQMKLL
ncbi:MAG: endonuclease Q family protein [Patescibacteria group bacterium]